jgi:hypothetical protein
MNKNKAQIAAQVKNSEKNNPQNKGKNMKNNTKRVNQKDAKAVQAIIATQLYLNEKSNEVDINIANKVVAKPRNRTTVHTKVGVINITQPPSMAECFNVFCTQFAPEGCSKLASAVAAAGLAQLVRDKLSKYGLEQQNKEETKKEDLNKSGKQRRCSEPGGYQGVAIADFSRPPYAKCFAALKRYAIEEGWSTVGSYVNDQIEIFFKSMFDYKKNNIISDDVKEEFFQAFKKITGMDICEAPAGRRGSKDITIQRHSKKPIDAKAGTKKAMKKLTDQIKKKIARANKGYSVNSIIRNAMSQVIAAKA